MSNIVISDTNKCFPLVLARGNKVFFFFLEVFGPIVRVVPAWRLLQHSVLVHIGQ